MAKLDSISYNGTKYELAPEIAPLFSPSSAYTKGDCVIHEAVLYKFTANHAAGAWTGNDVVAFEVGNRINKISDSVAPEFDSSASYTAGSYVYKNGVLYRFTQSHTGAWTGTDAVVVTVGGEVEEVKTDYTSLLDNAILSGWEKGTFDSTNGTNYDAETKYIRNQTKVGVITGAKRITCDSGYLMLLFAWDANGNFIGSLKAGMVFNKTTANFLLLNEYDCSTYPDYVVKVGLRRDPSSSDISTSEGEHCHFLNVTDKTLTAPNKAADAKATGDALSEKAEKAAVDDISVTEDYNQYITDIYTSPYTSGYISPNGAVSSSTTFSYTDKISVQPGDVLYGETTDGANLINFRFVCAYSGNSAVQSKGNSSDLTTYTVPEGIDGIVVSQRAASNGKTRSVRIERVRQNTTTNIKNNSMGYMKASGDMNDGDELHVLENNVKNNVCVVFTGNVTSFNRLYIGQRKDAAWQSCYIEIDATNVIIHTNQGDISNPHNLTIGSDIQILIETHNDAATSKIAVYSDGNSYVDTTPRRWICDNGYCAALSDESVLTDCVLSWTSRNINNPVWIFGDSYVSLYDVCWTYWMLQAGFDMPMINGFAGENSAQAMTALKNLIGCRKPQYILWALGMNDGDTQTAVNASWKKNYDIFVNLCKQYGITPILATIPSVPTINNGFKNAIVRNSGYRYVDFSKAVDPSGTGNWISGALRTDNVHPTSTGAKILFMRAIADFPELMSK